MQCLFLFIAALIYFMYAYLAFEDWIPKDSINFFFVSMAIGFLYSILWYFATIMIKDKTEYFMFVLIWDFVYISIFYLTPVLLFGVKIDKWGIIGVVSMVVGLLIMKIGHK